MAKPLAGELRATIFIFGAESRTLSRPISSQRNLSFEAL
jgi:hypothetical protein